MRVLQLSKFYPPVLGGIESVVYELTEGLNTLGVPCDVLCASTARHSSVTRMQAGYAVTRAASLGQLLSTSISPALIARAMRQANSYDIVHIHLPDPLTNLALLAARSRAKVVVHWHNDIVRQKFAVKLYAPLQKWLLDRADAVIATTTHYAHSSPWLDGIREKIVIIPIGIRDEPNPTSESEAQEIRMRFGGRRIVFACGRMAYYKGFEHLIVAAARLPEDCVVVIAGGGDLLESHRKLVARLGLSNRVFLVGPLSRDQTAAYHAAATIFCLPSINRAESFGVVLVEAMAKGKPVVATEIPGSGVPWVNENGVSGINVPPMDSTALANALNVLLHDARLREAMGASARQRYLRRFTARDMVNSTLDLYRRI